MPFLIQNRKTYLDEWLKYNHVAARRVRLRANQRIQSLLGTHENLISDRFHEHLAQPANRHRFSSYLDCTESQLRDRHRLILGQLICAIRTGDMAVFMNCCRHLAERWRRQDLPLEELWEALDALAKVCETTLAEVSHPDTLEQALYDHVTMTFQFAIDAVQEIHERHLVTHY